MSPALDRLARRCAHEPTFLAHALAKYQHANGFTDDMLAEELGCTLEALTRLRLCGTPRTAHFAADCRQIAERFNLDLPALERIAWPW